MPDVGPFKNFYFALEIDGFGEIANFMEMSGLKTTSEIKYIEEGGYNGSDRVLVGRAKFENIVLKQAVSNDTKLIEWRDEILQGKFGARRNGSVVIRANDGTEVRRITFIKGWPVSWEGPSLNSGQSGLMIETLEVAFESFVIDGDAPAPPPEPPPPPVPEQIDIPPIEFVVGTATPTPEGEAALAKADQEVKKLPPNTTVWVEGHTSDEWNGHRGDSYSRGMNQSLSNKRATTIANDLKAKNPDKTFIARGFGFQYPVANNATPARQTNRRDQLWTTPREGLRDGEQVYPGKW